MSDGIAAVALLIHIQGKSMLLKSTRFAGAIVAACSIFASMGAAAQVVGTPEEIAFKERYESHIKGLPAGSLDSLTYCSAAIAKTMTQAAQNLGKKGAMDEYQRAIAFGNHSGMVTRDFAKFNGISSEDVTKSGKSSEAKTGFNAKTRAAAEKCMQGIAWIHDNRKIMNGDFGKYNIRF